MNFEGPKPTHDQALDLVGKIRGLDKKPEEIVKNWEKFASEIPVGTEVGNLRDPLARGTTVDGRYYNNPTDNYVNISVNVVFKGLWRVVDVVKVEPTSQDK